MKLTKAVKSMLFVGVLIISVVSATGFIKLHGNNFEQDIVSLVSISNHHIFPKIP